MRYLAKVYVTPKPAVLDPQGRAIVDSLHALGYDEIDDVRLGKYIELTLHADRVDGAEERVEAMCRRLLANDVIETFRYEVQEHEG